MGQVAPKLLVRLPPNHGSGFRSVKQNMSLSIVWFEHKHIKNDFGNLDCLIILSLNNIIHTIPSELICELLVSVL